MIGWQLVLNDSWICAAETDFQLIKSAVFWLPSATSEVSFRAHSSSVKQLSLLSLLLKLVRVRSSAVMGNSNVTSQPLQIIRQQTLDKKKKIKKEMGEGEKEKEIEEKRMQFTQ